MRLRTILLPLLLLSACAREERPKPLPTNILPDQEEFLCDDDPVGRPGCGLEDESSSPPRSAK